MFFCLPSSWRKWALALDLSLGQSDKAGKVREYKIRVKNASCFHEKKSRDYPPGDYLAFTWLEIHAKLWTRGSVCKTKLLKYIARATNDLGIVSQGAVRAKTVAFDKPTWSYAYGDEFRFLVGSTGLQHFVASSSSAETLTVSSERNSSFA